MSSNPGLAVAAVARRLGVAPATLRTWDRRYGLGPSQHRAGSHPRYTDDDVAEVTRRFVRGAQAMEADGWFWRDPAASAASIRSGVTREILRRAVAPVWR